MKEKKSKGRHYHHLVKRMVLLLISFIFMSSLLAQERQITGVISDDQGLPLPGASVVVEGTTIGTTADANGKFSINAPQNATLIFSFIGYLTEKVVLSGQATVSVTLLPDIKKLDEVVVIGYGTAKKSDLTGAVTSVNSDAISKSAVTSLDQALQGRAAGVQMTTNTGIPGGGISIQIRGVNSINNSSEPMFIIDGVLVSGNVGTYTSNALSSINPADIESMEILKDASATAIYGVQAANGVIIITTKKGKAGKPRVSFDAQYGLQFLPKYLDMANLQEYAQHYNEYATLKNWGLPDWSADPSKLSTGTNWQEEVFRPAAMQNYTFSVAGGNENTTYKLSGNYLNQDGIAVGSGFDRITISTDITSKINTWLKVGGSGTFSHTNQVTTIDDWNLINVAVRQNPSVPARNLDGSYGGPANADESSFANPIALANLLDKGAKNMGARGNIYTEIKPANWITLKTELATDINQNLTHRFIPTYTLGYLFNSQIENHQYQTNSIYWVWRNLATFKKTLWTKHNVEAMFGHEVSERTRDYLYAYRYYGSNQLTDLSAGDENYDGNDGNTGRSSFTSVFGRLFYSFNEKYMLTATIRYDGSSNFAKGHQWGSFPSASVAWRISQEPFMKNLGFLYNLKLRLGYGEVGNANVGAFAYSANLSNSPTTWGTGRLAGNVPNENLTWETTKSYNAGLDLGLFKNRIELIADVYYKKTTDLLLRTIVPNYTGAGTIAVGSASAPWGNIGAIENKGIELTLNTVNIEHKDFQWRSNFMFTMNRNKVTELNTDNAQIDKTYQLSGTTYIVTRTEVGQSVGQFYGYKVTGRVNSASDLYDENGILKVAIPEKVTVGPDGTWVGDLLFENYNATDSVINELDRQYIGNPYPKFTFGFGSTLTYKNLDFSFQFSGSYGNDVMNFLALTINNPNTREGLTRNAAIKYAHLGLIDPAGSSSDINNVYIVSGDPSMPRISNNEANGNNRLSSRYIEDGSYLRLQNVSISYRVPKTIVSKIGFDNAKVYINIQNVYTFTKYSGYDPEVGMVRQQYGSSGQDALVSGIDVGRYPSPRIFTAGISVGF